MTAVLSSPRPAAAPPLERTAIVHDYITQIGGAERVAGHLARMLPEARLLTSVHRRQTVPLSYVGGRPWQTSFLQPLASHAELKLTLPLLPMAMQSLDVRDVDLVISSSSAFGHHVRARDDALHVCYCCTPARFLWHAEDYFHGRRRLRALLAPLLPYLRRLDLEAAARVDTYIAVSQHIAERIRKAYGREALVVHPPVDCSRFAPSQERSGRFLVLSRLVRTKRVDLVVEAANQLKLPVDIIGVGPEMARLQRLAGRSVRFLGWQPDDVVARSLAECTAAIVAGEEDFGLVTAEAQASGRPPVAFARGGAAEMIEDGVTGFLVQAQTSEAIGEAMLRARADPLDVPSLVASSRRFSHELFEDNFIAALDTARRFQLQTASVAAHVAATSTR